MSEPKIWAGAINSPPVWRLSLEPRFLLSKRCRDIFLPTMIVKVTRTGKLESRWWERGGVETGGESTNEREEWEQWKRKVEKKTQNKREQELVNSGNSLPPPLCQVQRLF